MRYCFRIFLFSLLLVFSASAAIEGNNSNNISHFTLDNGLQVFVKEDHRAPVAVFQIWYRVGSVDETPGTTGIAHVLEHMMFKGTDKHPEGEFNKIITENGGSQNAGTSNDFTYYYQAFAKDKIHLSFELESDRMQNLRFTQKDLDKELDVVKEERRMRTDNKPNGVLYERFLATAFISTPYHYPVIGWMHEIDQIHKQDVEEWYQRWYIPNNATVVIAGDVDPAKMKAMAIEYFGKIPAGQLPKQKIFKEVAPLGERRIQVKQPARVPAILMGFNTPIATAEESNWQPFALEVLASVLNGGRSSRFQKELVREQQITSSIGVYYDLLGRLPGLFTFSATPATGKTPADVEEAIFKQIERVQTTLVSEEELKRVKKQVIAGKIFGQDSLSSQASLLGKLSTLNLPWELYDNYVDRLNAVTPEQIQQVAKKYLVRDRLTVATLVPEGA